MAGSLLGPMGCGSSYSKPLLVSAHVGVRRHPSLPSQPSTSAPSLPSQPSAPAFVPFAPLHPPKMSGTAPGTTPPRPVVMLSAGPDTIQIARGLKV